MKSGKHTFDAIRQRSVKIMYKCGISTPNETWSVHKSSKICEILLDYICFLKPKLRS